MVKGAAGQPEGNHMWRRWVADIHLWISLFVGLQVLAWVVSGLFMSLQPIERVRSEHRLAPRADASLADGAPFVSVERAIESVGAPVRKLSLDRVGDRPVYLAETLDGRNTMLDARSGALISPISAGFARSIAEQAIRGDARAARVTLIARDPPIEYRGDLPVWRVDFADRDALSVYVLADTGRIAARRSDLWRAYDFLWAFHIMDYKTRENFNHPLLIAFSVGALLMTLAGMVLVVIRLPQRLRRRTSD